jgi:hypothetical protein
MANTHLPRLLPVLTLGAVAVLACGSARDGVSEVSRSSYWNERDQARTDGLAEWDRELVVPPDRATVTVRISFDRDTMAGAAQAVRNEVAAVQTATGTLCATSWFDAGPASSTDTRQWTATADLRVDIDLTGANDVVARLDRIDACLLALEPRLTLDGKREVDAGTDWVTRSGPVFSLLDPAGSYPQLVDRLDQELRRAAGVGQATQWVAQDWRCVPTGRVSTGTARISGIVVRAEVECRVAGAGPSAAVANADANAGSGGVD